MSKINVNVALNPQTYQWLENFSYEQKTDFSNAFDIILELGIRVAKEEIPIPDPDAISKDQKLVMQSVMETLFILRDLHGLAPEYQKRIKERARRDIYRILGKDAELKENFHF